MTPVISELMLLRERILSAQPLKVLINENIPNTFSPAVSPATNFVFSPAAGLRPKSNILIHTKSLLPIFCEAGRKL